MSIANRKPIDVFLASLAQDRGEYSVAVVLSGGDGDGTLGAKAVKEAGGLTLAQTADGDGPRNPDMPRSAIASGVIDIAVPVNQMADRLMAFARSFDMLDSVAQHGGAEDGMDQETARREICTVLSAHSGHDFSGYKTKTFFRRVRRRMQVRQLQTLAGYIELLRSEPDEVSNLFKDLLINVTNFFRDQDAFRLLEEQIIPKLFEGKAANDAVRIWVPGCATGEEVYSIAIQIKEHLDKVSTAPKVQIFATDIDEPALAVARAARYPATLLDGLSAERRRRFFKPDGASYVITNEVRELCIFSPHSLIRDPPFARMDMVSCRNLLIYLGPDVQRQVIPIFHYSLRSGGYLFLGSSESIGQYGELFATLDKKHRVFQARDLPVKMPRVPSLFGRERSTVSDDTMTVGPRESGHSLKQSVEARIIERHAPPHVVVNADADIVYYSAGTGRFLELPQGVPSRQLLTLARKGLRLDLRSALRECISSRKPVSRVNIVLDPDEDPLQFCGITIEPIDGGREQLFIVVFRSEETTETKGDNASASAVEGNHELERELRDTKERLQSTIEEYETALEELKSSNEELMSVNEEVQSSNEELEASKEETQSLNEELNTINAELNGKIEELDRANSDLRNLFDSTQIATIFLDRQLVIRTYTPSAATFFNLRPSDVGRPLTELSSRLEYPSFKNDIQGVFDSGEPVHHQLARDADGKHHLVRIIPYRASGEDIDGVVVTLVDVTQLAEGEAHKQVLISELNHRVKNMLAVVAAIAKRTIARSSSMEAFQASFEGRLGALARAYTSLSNEAWKDVSIREIFAGELQAFGHDTFTLEGSDLRLTPQQGLSLAMVAHELATNATKHGALSKENGRISIRWSIQENQLQVDWRERDGPTIGEPNATGFGFELLRGEIEYRLQGKLETHFDPAGLTVSFTIPFER
ncbi:CheR family methyltransferase [Sinorhizobium sp. NFACC03]|uniref:CheR family methyltransferase n=1 Tax=Sinorhizobium sp. NFACC03 TaxID=1566295 RepID=UPI00088AE485|nr:CheR family methyltransferase [Sinorhizobium sp. NFACC03]SDA93742.1 two-component system, chemotaxis family, CheB/CheR fusion protein [Sinorhizobium sp. NFACC03]